MHFGLVGRLSWAGLLCTLAIAGCSRKTNPCDATQCGLFSACEVDAGRAVCVCVDAGLISTSDHLACEVDPCMAMDAGGCDPHATCSSSTGVAVCTCNPGFSGDGRACQTADPCADGTAQCDWALGATCTSDAGQFECHCPSGYSGDGTSCTSIDFCGQGYCSGGACTNTPGSFSCVCPSGYVLAEAEDAGSAADGGAAGDAGPPGCLAENLCLHDNDCDPNAGCSSTPGSYTCKCNPGFVGNGYYCAEINACTTGASSCDLSSTSCVPDFDAGPGSYACECLPGYQPMPSTTTACESIPYCDQALTDGGARCGVGTCEDTPGSYACECPQGYVSPDAGLPCESFDFCGHGMIDCDINATCTDTPGSYACTCNPGFTGNGQSCMDVNECENGTAQCSPDAVCMNTYGSYLCACKQGYTGSGQSCTSDNFCQLGNVCSKHATCSDTPGSFACTCESGYVGSGVACWAGSVAATCTSMGKGKTATETCTCPTYYTQVAGKGDAGPNCVAGNPCDGGTATCNPNATCTNIAPGAAYCTCNTGYTGDGGFCESVPYCEMQADLCGASQACVDTPGSYECVTVPDAGG